MFGSKAIDSDSGSLCEILYCIVVEICERFSDSREMGGAHRERTVVAIRFTLGHKIHAWPVLDVSRNRRQWDYWCAAPIVQ